MNRAVPCFVGAIGLMLGGLCSSRTFADWTEFRGPGGRGDAGSASLPLEWNTTQNVAWKQAVPGSGWSSPVHAQGRIYLTTAVEGDGQARSLRLLCLSAETGKPIWNKEVFQQAADSPKIHRKNSHASPTPIIADDRIYVHFGHQGTACFDRDGELVWQRKLEYRPVHGNGGSPVLDSGLLMFSVDGASQTMIVALDARSGEERWRYDRKSSADRKFSFTTPLVLEVEGVRQLISPGSNMVCSVNVKTGEGIWRVTYDGYSVIPRPVAAHGLVYVCTGYNRPNLLAINPRGQGDVTSTHVAWETSKGVPHTPSLLLHGDELYMVSDRGVATCLDARTGKEHWQERIGGAFSASPLLAGERIYLQDEEGRGIVLAASPTFRQLAENELDEATLASYGVAGDALLIRTASQLYRIESK